MRAVLVMFKADGKRREFPLKAGTLVIGRQKTCQLRVPLPSVSRRHAELTVTADGGVSVRDLGSSNGTFRNGSRVEESVLEAGDELRVGPLELILADADSADRVEAPAPPVAAVAEDDAPAEASAFVLNDDGDSIDSIDLAPDAAAPGAAGSAGAGAAVSSPNPLDASASASAMSPIDLDGDDDEPAKPAAAAEAEPLDEDDLDDDDDLNDVLANFGRTADSAGSSEFDFLADVEVLDDDGKP